MSSVNLRIMSKVGLLFVVIGFFLPISCNLNGFQIAAAVETFGGPNILSVSLYTIFIFSCVGLILLFALLAKKTYSIKYDWLNLIIIIAAFSVFIYIQSQTAKGSIANTLYQIQSGAYLIFLGIILALVYLIYASYSKEEKTIKLKMIFLQREK